MVRAVPPFAYSVIWGLISPGIALALDLMEELDSLRAQMKTLGYV